MAQGEISQSTLLEALARTDRLSELLPILHQHAVEAIHGRSSILFQFDPSGEWLQATSAYGVERLPTEPWLSDGGLVPHALFRDGRPIVVPDLARSVRGVADYLGTRPRCWCPSLIWTTTWVCWPSDAPGRRPPSVLQAVMPVGHAFALALYRTRAARDSELQRDLGTLLQDFSRAVSSSLNLGAGLEALCVGANRLFGADRIVGLAARSARA